MRTDPEMQRIRAAQSQIGMALVGLQQEHNLTDVEILEAVSSWQTTKLKHMLRAERHPDGP